MKHLSKDDITRDKKPINCKSGKLEKVKTVEMYTEVENSEKLQQKKNPKSTYSKQFPQVEYSKLLKNEKLKLLEQVQKESNFEKQNTYKHNFHWIVMRQDNVQKFTDHKWKNLWQVIDRKWTQQICNDPHQFFSKKELKINPKTWHGLTSSNALKT